MSVRQITKTEILRLNPHDMRFHLPSMMHQILQKFWLVGSIALYWLGLTSPTRAQIVPDATLPVNSSVTSSGNTSLIEGGSRAGGNLFHSFREFSVPTGGTAFFNNAVDIQNIISRVTGGSVSNIDGLIRANGTINLFLINPNGIIFGPNSSLNIGGSFLASTANSLNFADGTQFSANAGQTPPLLTVSVPIGLQFGGSVGEIQVRGARLEVPGQTLALVGGDVRLVGGQLISVGGRIELGSVAGSGVVSLATRENGYALGYEGARDFQDIELSQNALVDASDDKGGDIQLLGGRVTLRERSQIIADTGDRDGGSIAIRANQLIVRDGAFVSASTLGEGAGGNLSVRASLAVELIGTSADGENPSGLKTETQGAGSGGNLSIETGQLMVRDGAQVSVAALPMSAGQGGNLSVTASESVELIGESANTQFVSGLFASSEGTGSAGSLSIATGRLSIQNGAQVLVSTFGPKPGGTLNVRASELIEVIGAASEPSGLFTSTEGAGGGGELRMETRQLIVRDGAQISASTLGSGNAGNVFVSASTSVELLGENENPSGIFAEVGSEATGNGGTLTIETVRLILQDGAEISTSTLGTGQGGNLNIETGQVIIQDGAQITTNTNSLGRGGTLTVNSSESVELIGTGEFPSGLFAQTQGVGAAGDLRIATRRLVVRDGAKASVSGRRLPGDERDLEIGNAGNLVIDAAKIRLEGGFLEATTISGDRGNITLQSRDIQLRRNSSITTNATGTAIGGNIFINTDTIAALENSNITANAEQDFGGQVKIDTQGIFRQGFLGTEIDRNPSPQRSDITATSSLGPQFDGIVDIETLNLDPSQGLFSLPATPPALLEQTFCAVVGQESAFVITGRGGLPPNPREALNLGAVMGNEANIPESNNTDTRQIVEAQGWVIDANGTVHLVARSPTVTPYSSGQNPLNCGNKN